MCRRLAGIPGNSGDTDRIWGWEGTRRFPVDAALARGDYSPWGDFDQNGSIDAEDVQRIVNTILGL